MPNLPPRERITTAAFQLKELRVDPAVGLINGPLARVHLEPRVMEVLQLLASSPGEVVTRSDLLTRIWPGGDTYDEALTQCVYQLRQQLTGAGGDEYRNVITTVPKRGYLLNCDVQAIKLEPAETATAQPLAGTRRLLFGGLATLLVVAATWSVLQWRSGTDVELLQQGTRTIAVLPFLPLVAEQREPTLEMGMADTLITRLSGIRQIIVRPVASVRRYGGMERDALQAGRELGVDAVVEGSIQRSGEAIRVSVRLLQVADGAPLWTATFDEQFSDIFSVQDAICERIAAALALELAPQDRQILARAGTSNTASYEMYLKGRLHLARLTPADLRLSVGYFREAVALDPGYAQAWLSLASVQFRIPIAGEARPDEFYPNAKLAAQTALEIDPSLAEGHAMLGWIAFWFEWDWSGSEVHFKRAIELNPNDTESHLGYAHLLSSTGRHEQALAEVRRARELSPFYLVAAVLEGGFLQRAQHLDEARQRLEDARQLNENFWLTRVALAQVYSELGRNEEALAEAVRGRQLSEGSTWAAANEVDILARLGQRELAESLMHEMVQRSATRYVPAYDLALASIGLDNPETALVWLERAYELHDPKLTFLGVDRRWNGLRSRPGFADLMSRMGLPVLPE